MTTLGREASIDSRRQSVARSRRAVVAETTASAFWVAKRFCQVVTAFCQMASGPQAASAFRATSDSRAMKITFCS